MEVTSKVDKVGLQVGRQAAAMPRIYLDWKPYLPSLQHNSSRRTPAKALPALPTAERSPGSCASLFIKTLPSDHAFVLNTKVYLLLACYGPSFSLSLRQGGSLRSDLTRVIHCFATYISHHNRPSSCETITTIKSTNMVNSGFRLDCVACRTLVVLVAIPLISETLPRRQDQASLLFMWLQAQLGPRLLSESLSLCGLSKRSSWSTKSHLPVSRAFQNWS
jgi:hypothetical protein